MQTFQLDHQAQQTSVEYSIVVSYQHESKALSPHDSRLGLSLGTGKSESPLLPRQTCPASMSIQPNFNTTSDQEPPKAKLDLYAQDTLQVKSGDVKHIT